jgi:putative phosphoesterase
MRLGLISDTHIPEVAKELPPQIMEVFRGVDLILHCGDIYTLPVLDELERMAPVLAAMGDDDPYTVRQDDRVKNKHILKLEGRTLWLIHEKPYLHIPASQQGGDDNPDIVVFGHTHATSVQRRDGVLFVNPGSPTFLKYQRGPGTVGILDIDSAEEQAVILHL